MSDCGFRAIAGQGVNNVSRLSLLRTELSAAAAAEKAAEEGEVNAMFVKFASQLALDQAVFRTVAAKAAGQEAQKRSEVAVLSEAVLGRVQVRSAMCTGQQLSCQVLSKCLVSRVIVLGRVRCPWKDLFNLGWESIENYSSKVAPARALDAQRL